MKNKDWYWTNHIKEQMVERDITTEEVEAALINPDDIMLSKENRKIYQKMTRDKLLRVVTEGNRFYCLSYR